MLCKVVCLWTWLLWSTEIAGPLNYIPLDSGWDSQWEVFLWQLLNTHTELTVYVCRMACAHNVKCLVAIVTCAGLVLRTRFLPDQRGWNDFDWRFWAHTAERAAARDIVPTWDLQWPVKWSFQYTSLAETFKQTNWSFHKSACALHKRSKHFAHNNVFMELLHIIHVETRLGKLHILESKGTSRTNSLSLWTYIDRDYNLSSRNSVNKYTDPQRRNSVINTDPQTCMYACNTSV